MNTTVCKNCACRCELGERYCRKCGTGLGKALGIVSNEIKQKNDVGDKLRKASSNDPDELTGNGIGSVIMGDGFLIVAVMLSATQTAVSSLLWLLLLIPAFFFFGKGFKDVLLAKQIRRRLKEKTFDALPTVDLSASGSLIAEAFRRHLSGELVAAPSVTERTTRELK